MDTFLIYKCPQLNKITSYGHFCGFLARLKGLSISKIGKISRFWNNCITFAAKFLSQ